MSNNSKIVMGTLGAALAGAAAGILLAPKKGTETRKMIKDKANDLSANAKKTWDKNLEKGKSTFNELSGKVKENFNKNSNSDRQFDTSYQSENRYKTGMGSSMADAGTTSSKSTTSDDKYSANTGSTLGGSGTSSGSKSTNESYQANKSTSVGGTGTSSGTKSTDDTNLGNKSSFGGTDSSKSTSSNDPTKKYGGSV